MKSLLISVHNNQIIHISFNLFSFQPPMSYSSSDVSFSYSNGMEGGVVGSRAIGCVCNLPVKREKKTPIFFSTNNWSGREFDVVKP